MRRYFVVLLFSFSPNLWAQSAPIEYDFTTIHRELKQGGFKRTDSKSYIGVDLPFQPFAEIRKEVEIREKTSLQNRGEAHITVISPPELKILLKHLSQIAIDKVADELKTAEIQVKLLCVGKGQKKEQLELGATYFVVARADQLFEVRRKLGDLFRSQGGKPEDFNAEQFFPHVTLGFTKRDLHLEDGVIKNTKSCVYTLKPKAS